MKTSIPSRSRRSAAQWADLVEQSQSTSLSLREFCEKQNIPLHGLYFWRSKLRASGPPKRRGFTPVRTSAVREPAAADACVEVRLQNGRVVRITGAVDPRVLQTVICAAEGSVSC